MSNLLLLIFYFQLDGRNVKVDKYPNGNFMGPTIITNMNTNMKAYKTEIFGPVLCVVSVDTLEEAIEVGLLSFWLLNQSTFHMIKLG